MSKVKANITDTILKFLEENKERLVESKEIYDEVGRKVQLTTKQLEEAYERPRFQHTVRNTLLRLTKSRKIIRVSRGQYKFNDRTKKNKRFSS